MLYRVLVLLFAFSILVLPLSASAQDDPHETYTTSDGSLSFSYPTGWFVTEDATYLVATVSNVPYDEVVYSDVPSGMVVVQVFAGVIREWWDDMNLSDDPTALEMAEQYPRISYVQLEQIEGPTVLDIAADAALVGGTEYGSETLHFFIVFDGDVGIFLTGVTAVGEMEQYRDTIMEIAASAAYNIPSPNAGRVTSDDGPPAVAGTGAVAWQQQRPSSWEDRQFNGLGPVAVAPDGTIYVADSRYIRVLDADGTVTGTIINGHIETITDMVLAEDGTLWLADSVGAQVLNLSTEGTVLNSFGKSGRGPGQFGSHSSYGQMSPVGLDIGPDGNLYVFDLQPSTSAFCEISSRIQVFDTQGTFIREFPTDLGDGQCLDMNYALMSFGSDGNIYAVGYYTGIAVFDPQGSLMNDRFAEALYQQNLVAALVIDADGLLYAATPNGLFVLDSTGTQIAQFGTMQATSSTGDYPPLAPGEFRMPVGIGLAPNGDVIIADANNSYSQIVRIQVTGLGL